ncbi:hypothetical protein GZ78_17575 [Endozoicomonas numazuensis]|uniref:Uncharacterized protein n=1 Tax=Endozoicomonas numazuensis TaxID=1137799 RepID=A0A081NGI1_9GAMM|nr:hypothetical protein GZ78_14285 [Endozoicomonas numazuensis]KEQ17554.1 hypothetical protein GZ78_17575 [Endozoicomonas numazuensis]
MDSKVSKFFVLTNGVTISILLIAQKLALFFIITVGQLLPFSAQANTLMNGERLNFISDDRPMLVETGLIKNVHSFEVAFDQGIQVITENSTNTVQTFSDSLPLEEANSEQVTEDCKTESDQECAERVAFNILDYISDHIAYILGLFLALWIIFS